MNAMKHTWAAAALLGLGVMASAASAQNVTLTFSSYNAPTHPLNADVLYPWFEEVSRVTEGRVTIQPLPVMVGEAAGQYDVAADGIADVTFFTPGYNPGRFDVSALGEMPLVTDDPLIGAIAYQRFYDRVLAPLDVFDEVHVLSLFTTSAGQLFTRRPINSPADLQGLRVRSPLAMTTIFAEAIGATPVQRPVTEAYELLSTGVLDGTMSGIDQVNGYHLHDVTGYLTVIPGGLYNSACGVVINHNSWQRISEADQAAIMAISGEYLAGLIGEAYADMIADSLATMEASGQVNTASPEIMAFLEAGAAAVETDLFARIERGGISDPAGLLAEYREIIEEVTAEIQTQ